MLRQNRKELLQVLKIFRILLMVLFVPLALFYFGIVMPEFIACNSVVYEGETVKDIWGSEVSCHGEEKDLTVAFFQLISFILVVLLVLISGLYILEKKIKNKPLP